MLFLFGDSIKSFGDSVRSFGDSVKFFGDSVRSKLFFYCTLLNFLKIWKMDVDNFLYKLERTIF